MKEKDKRCVHKKEDTSLSQNGSVRGGTLPYPAFTSGDGGSCDGACRRYHKRRKSLLKISAFPTISLISMWTIAGHGFRGTGWTALENQCSTGFTVSQTLSGR